MTFKKPFLFVFFTSLIFLSLKWILSIYFFDESLITSILINTSDIQYYPLIVSLSELNLNPTFLQNYTDSKIINFPLFSLIIHSFFYKFFGIYSFIILEFFLHILLIFILFKIINNIFNNTNIAAIFCLSIFCLIAFLKVINIYFDVEIFQRLYELVILNFGTRVPRPLVTGIFYFGFLYNILLFEKKNNEGLNYTYVFILAFILGLLANSFFFLFIHCLYIVYTLYRERSFCFYKYIFYIYLWISRKLKALNIIYLIT